MRIVVIGGGITGQLVQYAIPSAEVFDWSKPERAKLTRSFGTNYLHEPLAGIPCRAFDVVTHVDGRPPNIETVALYKKKIGKAYDLDKDILTRQFPERSVGYEMEGPLPVSVTYDARAVEINTSTQRVIWADGRISSYDILVSTIPLYALLKLVQGGAERWVSTMLWWFSYDSIYVKINQRPPDAPYPPDHLYVNYLSDPAIPAYRFCDRGQDRHYEGLTRMGTLPTMTLTPGKIHPLPMLVHDQVLGWLYERNIRCFGRFARWVPDELVHETYRNICRFKESL